MERDRQQAWQGEGLPVPYGALFAGYATSTLSLETSSVKLTVRGREAVQGKAKVDFYDETLPLLRPELVNSLLQVMGECGGGSKFIGTLAAEALQGTQLSLDQAIFHIALLTKRGILEIEARQTSDSVDNARN